MAEMPAFEEYDMMDDKVYPQFKAMENASRFDAKAETFPALFMYGDAVLNRPDKITEVSREGNAITVCFSVRARKSVHAYTHETEMYLYQPAEKELESLWMRIEFWSDSIFRVVITKNGTAEDPFANLPEEGRMLIGHPQDTKVSVTETEKEYVFSTETSDVILTKKNCALRAQTKDGTLYYAQRKSEFQTNDIFDLSVSDKNGSSACFEALELENDELIYGLGERFDGLVRNGREVDFHNKDAVGTTSRRTYINIPFFVSTKGYGLFLNSSARTDWQIGTRDASALAFSVNEGQMDYFVLQGDPKKVLHDYCTLTGFTKLPPLWSFGLWMSRNSYTSWDIAEDVARQVRAHDIPCDVVHLDTAWFNRDWNCDLRFSEERFPEPEKHLKALKDDGFHVSLWQYNFIPPNADNTHYREAVEKGYLAKNAEGKPYQLPDTCKGSWTKDVIVDFSNPEARKWYYDKIYALIKMGAGAIKTDFGEGIPEEALYYGIDGAHNHNLYTLLYNAVVFAATKDASGENIVWARSGTAGSQRYPLHWGGDSQCSFDALAGTLRAALSAGMCGIAFFSHDIGGFIGTPNDELYVRWAQLGLFSSHSRCHGAGDNNYREPWRYSAEACEIFRFYDKLRYSLMPYIYSQAEKCTETGLPMMRSLPLEYPEDRNVRYIDDEYMFGDSLLIAPVLKPLSVSRVRKLYLPAGVWFDFFTKEKIESNGTWIEKPVELKTLPIYVKQGAELSYCSADTTLANGMGDIVKTERWL